MSSLTSDTILVLGATGTTGREVARQLVEAGHKPRLLVRNESRPKAAEFEGKAFFTVGDLEDDIQLAKAVEGIERVYLVSAGLGGGFLEVRAIDAAKAAGVKHVVKLSVFNADHPDTTFGEWHAETERYLMNSGLDWTMLRPVNFHTNALLMWAATVKAQGTLYDATQPGRYASVDPADIGAIAAKALTTAGHAGKAYALTGPESLNGAGYAEKLSAVLGKPVSVFESPLDSAREGLKSYGIPEAYVEAAVDLMAKIKADKWDVVSPDLQNVLGRPATGFEDWARRNVAAFS